MKKGLGVYWSPPTVGASLCLPTLFTVFSLYGVDADHINNGIVICIYD